MLKGERKKLFLQQPIIAECSLPSSLSIQYISLFKSTPLGICHFADGKLQYCMNQGVSSCTEVQNDENSFPPSSGRHTLRVFNPCYGPNLDCAKSQMRLDNTRNIFAAGFWLFFPESLLWNGMYNTDSSWLEATDGGLASLLASDLLRIWNWKWQPLSLFWSRIASGAQEYPSMVRKGIDWICHSRVKTL